MSCVFAKQKRQRVAKIATLLQCTKKSLMGTRLTERARLICVIKTKNIVSQRLKPLRRDGGKAYSFGAASKNLLNGDLNNKITPATAPTPACKNWNGSFAIAYSGVL